MRPSYRSLAFISVLAIVLATVMSPAAAGGGVTRRFVKQFVKKRIASLSASVATIEGRTTALESSLDAHRSSADHDGRYWKLGGNTGAGGTTTLGTTGDHPLVLIANGEPALRLEGTTRGAAVIPNLIGGWSGNEAAPGIVGATIGGGGCPSIVCTLPRPNVVTADHGTIAGGDTNTASGTNASVGGGRANIAGPGIGATVGGGQANTASGISATVGGGMENTASGIIATVGGGIGNEASGNDASVGGGHFNDATGNLATVGGGEFNVASGKWATVGGGVRNDASGLFASVGGGHANIASGSHASVPGGRSNSAAGDGSFAAGSGATVETGHHGTFIWADQTGGLFRSGAANEFAVRATGGARFVSAVDGSGVPTAGVTLSAGGGSWSSISDRAAKKAFVPVDPGEVLQGVVDLPIATWSYKTQADGIRHIGPVAQDFHTTFGVGESDTSITAVDADGVALAAIQGLNEKLETRIADLESRLAGTEQPGSFPRSGLVWALAALALGLGLGVGGAVGRRIVPAA